MSGKNYGHVGNPDVTSLDEDLKNMRDSKFTKENIQEIQEWVFHSVLQGRCDDVLQENNGAGVELLDLLRDGSVLCELANVIGGVTTTTTTTSTTTTSTDEEAFFSPIKYKKNSKMPFVQMEQISFFLEFAKRYGVPQDELFSTVDLFEKTDPAIVYQTLKSLSRYANEKSGGKIPVLGPRLSKKHTPPLKPKKPTHLQVGMGGAAWSTTEFGYMKGANQKTEKINIGSRRGIISDL